MVWLAGGFRGDLSDFCNFFEDSNGVDGGIFLDGLEIANIGEIEANLRDTILLFGLGKTTTLANVDAQWYEQCDIYLLHNGVSLERQLVVVVEIGELLLCELDATGTRNVVDTALLKDVVKRIALIVEACASNLPTLV